MNRRARFGSGPRRPGWRDERGQGLVEFALIAPLLLLLIFGIVEFGRAWNAYQVITDAAREGARVAVVSNMDPNVAQTVDATVRNAIARAGYDANAADVELAGMGDPRGTPARVSITYPYRFALIGALLKAGFGSETISLQTTFVMRNE